MNLPHDITSELCILGSCLLDATLVDHVNLEWFYDHRYREVAHCMMQMREEGVPIDSVTLFQRFDPEMKKRDWFRPHEFIDLVPSAANFEYWAEILEELRQLRAVAEITESTYRKAIAKGAVARDVVEEFEKAAMRVRSTENAVCVDLPAKMQEVIDQFHKAYQNRGRILAGISTGYPDLDRLTMGMREGQMIVLAARPSVGKTSLAMNIAERAAVDSQTPVGVFSLEMSSNELLQRMACSRAGVDGSRATTGEMEEEEMQRLSDRRVLSIATSRLHIIDQGGLSISQIRGRARRLKSQFDIKLLIVDYLQLVNSGGRQENRNAAITVVSNGIKEMARELGIPVLALAQLSREAEKDNRKPRLSDLRDSGSIEQDADIVLLMHREKETDNGQVINVIVAKNRSGRCGCINLIFFPQFTRFESSSRIDDAQPGLPYNDQ